MAEYRGWRRRGQKLQRLRWLGTESTGGRAEAYLGVRGEQRDQGHRSENAVSAPCNGGSEEASPAAFIARTSLPEAVVGSTPDVRIGKGPKMPWLGQTAGRRMLYRKPGSCKKPSAEGTRPASVTMATRGAGERS